MAKKLQKHLNVDVIALLEEKMKGNTKHYQSDFETDKRIIIKAASSARREDKTLLWFSRSHGTQCNKEHEVFIRDSAAHTTWRYYAEQESSQIVACAVEVKKVQDGAVLGNVFDLDFQALAAEIMQKSVSPLEIEQTFEDGFVDRVPVERSSYGYYYDLVEKHGAIVDSFTFPKDDQELKAVLAEQKRNRDKLKEAGKKILSESEAEITMKPSLDSMMARASARMKQQSRQAMDELDKQISFNESR